MRNKILCILSQTRYIHIILFISIIICIYIFSLSSNDLSSPLLKKHLRNLEIANKTINSSEEFKNNNETLFNNSSINNLTNNSLNENVIVIKIRPVRINLTEKIMFYEFIKTITTGFYYGDWNNLHIKKNRLHEKKGEGYISIYRKRDKNYLLNLGEKSNSSRVSVYFTLKDGQYVDDYLEGNFTFGFEDISVIDLKNETINFILEDVPVSYSWEDYLDSDKMIHLNHTFINLTFYKAFRKFENYMEYKSSSNYYGNVSLEIKNYTFFQNNSISNNNINKNYTQIEYEKNLELSFKGLAYGSNSYSKNTLNYSIFLTVFCIIEIFLSADFVKLVNTNDQMALNTDLYTILFHIMWTSLVCGVNFFMCLTRKSSAYEYTMPSFCYFILFSIFLLRILFLAWRARNRDITNMQVFRKKLLSFYLLFYVFLFITLISVKLWYSYFIFTFILFASTWISQIIYSAKKGTSPPMSYLYIISTSFSKISISFYIKGYSNNIFGYRPNYIKVFIVSGVIIIEALILCLQKFLGAKFIIPKRYRKQGYNYYKNENEISQNEKETECAICLDKLGNLVDAENEKISNNNKRKNYLKKKIIKYIEKYKVNQIYKEKYMVTPCKHHFHTKCLESWLKVKSQCPYCRQKLPSLED